MIRYLFSAREDAEKYNNREYFREVEGEYMTLLEKIELQGIEKGERIGIEKGKLEGKLENKMEIAKNMMAEGMEITMIQKVTKLSPEELREIGIA